ncbi:MAG: MFS transporter [Ruminococcaceae bacterium]|nr:MFS transporter [Oscillospiraceae bacterium]
MLIKNKQAKNAVLIGTLCSISYLAVYFARNTLGAVKQTMINEGDFTFEQTGMFSSLFFMAYAIGQLINGYIGDKIKAKYMISFGLILAGISNIVFANTDASYMVASVAYCLTGFFLSMIYGPMTKVVSENTEPLHATRCSLGYTLASFLGSPMAGFIAVFLSWQGTFAVSSISLIVMGIICFSVFLIFEKKGIVKYGQYQRAEDNGGSIKILIKHHIIKFTLISVITGVIRTTVIDLLTTYYSQYHNYSDKNAKLIFTVTTLIITTTSFISVFIYEKMGRNINRSVLIFFSFSAVFFLLVFFIKSPVLNIIFLVLAIMASNASATMLWSVYCPSLKRTGMISSATGFLDFMSYMSAAASSALFAWLLSPIGWRGLILIWTALMVLGILISLPHKQQKNQ